MLDNPTISVVISSYNRAEFIEAAIRSAQNQNYNDKEIIVVDDGSTDATRTVLNQFGTDIKVIHQNNQGRSASRNQGVKHANGRFIAFLDSDDVWTKDKLDKQISTFSCNQDIGLVHTFSDVIDANGILVPRESKLRKRLYQKSIQNGYTYESLSRNCLMFLSTVMVRKECWDKIGPARTEEKLRKMETYLNRSFLIYY